MAQFDYTDERYGGYDQYGADAQWDAEPEAAPRGGRLSNAMNWAGAVMSLGLMVGMAVWAVQLTLRDVSGVPVIAAIEGPMREAPADPGGVEAPHQGLAVNRIAEGQEAGPVPNQLVLAPPPIELQEVVFEPTADIAPEPRLDPAARAAAVEGTDDSVDAVTTGEATSDTEALIERLLREAQPIEGLASDAPSEPPLDTPTEELASAETVLLETEAPDAVAVEVASVSGFEILPASVPGISRSLVPAARPAAFVTRSRPAGTVAPPASITEEVAVADLPDGTRLVQLGAFDTADIAREEWDRIAGLFPDFFEARPRVIEEASSGGQTFFRLRAAGFDDLAGSRRFCAVLVAQGTACIPVTVR